MTFIDSTAIQALDRRPSACSVAPDDPLRLGNPVRHRHPGPRPHRSRPPLRPSPSGHDTAGAERRRRRHADALQAILNELALRLLTEQLARAPTSIASSGFTCDTIPPCRAASIALLIDGRPSTVAVNEHVALELDIAQYEHRRRTVPRRPARTARSASTSSIADERFTHFAHGAADHRVNSVLSMPIIRHDDVVGTLNLYAARRQRVRRRRHRHRPDRSHPSCPRHRPLRLRRRRAPSSATGSKPSTTRPPSPPEQRASSSPSTSAAPIRLATCW